MNEMEQIIRSEYVEIVKALGEAEKEYSKNKRSQKNRQVYEYLSAQEMAIANLCDRLQIQLYDDDLQLIAE